MRLSRGRATFATAAGLAALALLPAYALAGSSKGSKDVTCSAPITYGTISGNVSVPAGKTCTLLSSVVIEGNLTLGKGSALLDAGATLGGNVDAKNAAWIDIKGGTIKGHLQLTATKGTPTADADALATANDICNTTILGDVQVNGSSPTAPFEIGAAPDCSVPLTVGGNLSATRNAARLLIGPAGNGSGSSVKGSLVVSNNTGGGVLRGNSADTLCKLMSNSPAIMGSGNTAPPAHKYGCNASA